MGTFIITQILITDLDTNEVEVVIRKVRGHNEAEAIGKFVIDTNEMPYKRKLNIEVLNLNELITIK